LAGTRKTVSVGEASLLLGRKAIAAAAADKAAQRPNMANVRRMGRDLSGNSNAVATTVADEREESSNSGGKPPLPVFARKCKGSGALNLDGIGSRRH
jgi:hypothetical protein